jgi:hypothetical protein
MSLRFFLTHHNFVKKELIMHFFQKFLLVFGVLFIAHATCVAGSRDCEFIRGDCNSDGVVDISDATSIIHALSLGAPLSGLADACDANDDGVVDLSDAIYILSMLYQDGEDISSPYPEAGYDPTDDGNLCCEPIANQEGSVPVSRWNMRIASTGNWDRVIASDHIWEPQPVTSRPEVIFQNETACEHGPCYGTFRVFAEPEDPYVITLEDAIGGEGYIVTLTVDVEFTVPSVACQNVASQSSNTLQALLPQELTIMFKRVSEPVPPRISLLASVGAENPVNCPFIRYSENYITDTEGRVQIDDGELRQSASVRFFIGREAIAYIHNTWYGVCEEWSIERLWWDTDAVFSILGNDVASKEAGSSTSEKIKVTWRKPVITRTETLP